MDSYEKRDHMKNHSSMIPNKNCKICKMEYMGRENTQGLIDKELLLD